MNYCSYFVLIVLADACPLSPDPSLAGMTIEMIKKRKQIKEANKNRPVKYLLTTTSLKWRLGAWSIQGPINHMIDVVSYWACACQKTAELRHLHVRWS